MTRSPRQLRFSVLAILCTAPAHAQVVPGQVIPQRSAAAPIKSPHGAQLRTRVERGTVARKAGNPEAAVHHILAGLSFGPATPSATLELLRAVQPDANARVVAGLRAWLACMDKKGRFRCDPPTRELFPADALHPSTLAKARVDAVLELAQFVKTLRPEGKRNLGNSVLLRWAHDMAWELMRDAPALQDSHGAFFRKACERNKPDYHSVIQALQRVAKLPPKKVETDHKGFQELSPEGLATRAARCLTGLAAQARFKDLKGPRPPELGVMPEIASKLRGRLRQAVSKKIGKAWTIQELQALDAKGRERFSAKHASWNNPGIAVSPTGKYLLQTTCGFETLLGAAQTVEMHHARLANWFGKDPFKQIQGIVRIVPETAALESESSPFWWAGGFQAGNRTTLKFAWGSISGLGRALTHELTHRFDGVLFPFLPAWLVEGRAVWTGSSYHRAEDTQFTEKVLNHWTVQTPFVNGYAGRRKFEKLLEGTIEDYRDNYSAGYALFAFLRSWQIKGKQVFRKRLAMFMRRARAGKKNPIAFFERHFADGKNGRPKKLDAFMKEWGNFLRGCYKRCWNEEVPWLTQRHVVRAPNTGRVRGGLVMDRPTWSWSRNNAEPWWGDGQAALAGHVLDDASKPKEAAAAYLWALCCDGWREDVTARLAPLLEKLGRKDAAWVVRSYRARRLAHDGEWQGLQTAPFLARLSKLQGFFAKQAELAQAARDSKLFVAAQMLEEQRRQLGRLVALRGPAGEGASPAQGSKKTLLPGGPEEQHLAVHGLVETGLTGFEKRRLPNCWFENEDGDIHVGRVKPRGKTGLLDRRAHQRHSFVRTAEYFDPGEYVLKTRIHFTTSFISGAVILGYTRRDRNIRLHFSAGDFLYSIGKKDDVGKTEAVSLRIGGLWSREGQFTQPTRHKFKFEHASSFFRLEMHVVGPTVHVKVEGKHLFSYTTPDLSPIEGHIGFAMGQGAVRVQRPMLTRLDRPLLPAAAAPALPGLRIQATNNAELSKLVGREVEGLPRWDHGTIVIALPFATKKLSRPAVLAKLMQRLSPIYRDPLHHPQRWFLLLPKDLGDDERRKVKQVVEKRMPKAPAYLDYAQKGLFPKRPFVLFIDHHGVLRSAGVYAKKNRLHGGIDRWARCYRRNGG